VLRDKTRTCPVPRPSPPRGTPARRRLDRHYYVSAPAPGYTPSRQMQTVSSGCRVAVPCNVHTASRIRGFARLTRRGGGRRSVLARRSREPRPFDTDPRMAKMSCSDRFRNPSFFVGGVDGRIASFRWVMEQWRAPGPSVVYFPARGDPGRGAGPIRPPHRSGLPIDRLVHSGCSARRADAPRSAPSAAGLRYPHPRRTGRLGLGWLIRYVAYTTHIAAAIRTTRRQLRASLFRRRSSKRPVFHPCTDDRPAGLTSAALTKGPLLPCVDLPLGPGAGRRPSPPTA